MNKQCNIYSLLLITSVANGKKRKEKQHDVKQFICKLCKTSGVQLSTLVLVGKVSTYLDILHGVLYSVCIYICVYKG